MNDYLGRELAIYDIVTGELKEVNIFGNGLVGKIMIDDSDATGYYYSKDHLGSIRVVMNDAGNITAAQDYYPYGELLREYNSASQRYQFTEKEKDGESSYLHFDARTLDPSLPMWLQVDPLSEKYPGWSPYNYTQNNPIRFVDPDGNGPWDLLMAVTQKATTWIMQKSIECYQKIENNKNATVSIKTNGEMKEYTAKDLLTNADINSSRAVENSLGKIEDMSSKVGTVANIATPIIGAINPAAGGISLKVGAIATGVSTLSGIGKEAMQGNTEKILLKVAISGGSQLAGTKMANYMAGLDPKNAARLEQTFKPLTETIIDGANKVINQQLEKKKEDKQ